MRVKEIMTDSVDFVTNEHTLQQAAEKMKALDVGELPIIVGKEAVGVITDRDIAIRGVALGLDPNSAKVVDAMSEGIIACKQDDEAEMAARLMAEHKIRRLPVTDTDGNVTGMLSLGDLAAKLDKSLIGDVLMQISR
jgi:CBS domain-containing protein